MNPSSLALASAFLFAASSAVDNTATGARKATRKQKTRRGLNADGENMSMDKASDEAAGILLPSDWWGHGDHDACLPKTSECAGRSYYKIIDVPTAEVAAYSWTLAYEATPSGCILAPIPTQAEWVNLLAEAKALNGAKNFDRNLFIGVTKPALTIQNNGGSKAGWTNLDGTPAAVGNDSQWEGDSPDNDGVEFATENVLHLRFLNFKPEEVGLLNDLPDEKGPFWDDKKWGAIYKCCDNTLISFPTCDE